MWLTPLEFSGPDELCLFEPQKNAIGKVIKFKSFSIYPENFKSIFPIVIENSRAQKMALNSQKMDSYSQLEVNFPMLSIGYKLHIYTNHSWKNLGNWSNSLWEITRTNYVEKIRRNRTKIMSSVGNERP